MKTNHLIKIILIILLFMTHTSLYACDVCGGSGNYSFGLLPKNSSKFIGLRYQFNAFDFKHPPLFGNDTISGFSRFHSVDLWGRYSVMGGRIHFYLSVPFVFQFQQEGITVFQTASIGDASLFIQSALVQLNPEEPFKIKHNLFAGIGLKIPTGPFQLKNELSNLLPYSVQPGSGSFDLLINAIYSLQYKKFGWNLELGHRFNFRNQLGLKIGDKSYMNNQFFLKKEFEKFSFMPYLMQSIEYRQKDNSFSIPYQYTGGFLLNLGIGADLFFKNFSLGLWSQYPVYQYLGENLQKSSLSLQARMFYLF